MDGLSIYLLMADVYYTIAHEGNGKFTDRMSRFLGFAFKVTDVEEAKSKIKAFQNEYHDARHVCWAYMIGKDRTQWQLNDNGEPSGTAGKPILGQINSRNLTDVLVIVVRYFGGIKLGTPGLINAYREAASLSLDDAGKMEMHSMTTVKIRFPYVSGDGVMKAIKNSDAEVLSREFDNVCEIKLQIREDKAQELVGKIIKAGASVLQE